MSNSLRPSAQVAKLPKSREVLALLLFNVQEFLCVAEGFQQRQHLRTQAMSSLWSDSEGALQRQQLIRAANRESKRQWARGIPSLDALVPYLDAGQVNPLLRDRESGLAILKSLSLPAGNRETAHWLDVLDRVIRAEGALLDALRGFRTGVIAALEQRVDTRVDTARKFARVLPRNPLALKLYFELQQNRDPETSEAEVARDFAARHGKNATSLLKAARRLAKRLQSD